MKSLETDDSFRTKSIMSQYGLHDRKIVERFIGDLPLEGREWSIGVIVGNSATGKTTIAREIFPQSYINGFVYDQKNVLLDMPKSKTLEDITRVFTSVGFSSVPSWLKPYRVLSNGEKMRVDMARAILEEREMVVFDEFTSVIDREVAKIASWALSKCVRRIGKKFIAVTCHYDVIDWLEPDWVFDTNTMTFSDGKKKVDLPCDSSSSREAAAIGISLGAITI
jgi:ABC-type ATPase with predicted acetyltransferase domain